MTPAELAPFPPEDRRRVMQAVGKNDTEAEMRLRRAPWIADFRYRLHPKIAGTRPDLCFVRAKVALFVDGCLWHGCLHHYPPQCITTPSGTRNSARTKPAPEGTTEGWRRLGGV